MKRVRCPKCDHFIQFDETKYTEGQSLVFVCDNCQKQFGIRIGVSKLRALQREESKGTASIPSEDTTENVGTIVAVEGLTYNLYIRNRTHKNDKKSEVYKHSLNANIEIPTPKQLTEYINKNEASEMETYYYNEYKNNGWIMLNVAKTGCLGGCRENSEYTKEYCKILALNYKTKREFEKHHKYLYNKIRNHGWSNYVFSHMSIEESKKIKAEKIRKSKIGKKMNITDKNNFRKSHSSNPIVLVDDNNNVIEEFFSATICAEKIGGTPNGIRNACKNGRKYKNINLKYKNKYIPQIYNKKYNSGNSKKVAQYTLDGVYITEYPSIKKANLMLGKHISSQQISKCCNGKIPNYMGYIWKFV